MRYSDASIRLRSAAILGAVCIVLHGGPAAGQGLGQREPFNEDFSSGAIDWALTWDTNGGKDRDRSYYRIDRLSPGFLVYDRQSFYSHSAHDYFHEQVVQALLPASERGFWDTDNECWVGMLRWSRDEGWYAASPHDWRFSVELQEGALMASILSGGHPMDAALKAELFYIHKRINSDGTLADLSIIGGTQQGAYEYGLVLSALALGSRYFQDEDELAGRRAYDDLRRVFSCVIENYPERMLPCEESAVMMRGFVNARDAMLLRGDTLSGQVARSRCEKIAQQFLAAQASDGSFEVYDGKLHVQKQLKADIGLLLAHAITGDRRYIEAAKRNMDWVIANRWDSSPKSLGGLMWAADDMNSFFECHQMWFILAAHYLESCSEYSYRPYLEDAFAFLTDDNCGGVDMYEHNAETYGAFFSYRAISRDGTIQGDPFHQWKGAYEIGASLWALASIRGTYSEGHSRLVAQAPEDSSTSWNKAIYTERNFGNGAMSFRWDAQFKDVRYPGAYTGLFNDQAGDWLIMLDTTSGLSYKDISGAQRVLVDESTLRSGAVYTVKIDRLDQSRIHVQLLEDGNPICNDLLFDARKPASCYFGVYKDNGSSLSPKAVFVDNLQYAPLGSEIAGALPDANRMRPGYPNPFNAGISIEYDVAARQPVSLRVYNAAGELVADLVDGIAEAGSYSAFWNGRNRNGAAAASGIYFCSFVTPDVKQNQKLVLVR
jgi:hypothetical protein